ncbi:MAG: hypothetical protein O9352_10315 [Rhizobium sp.]|jgi:hypothetical protein|nr:hypothetical protein [Rhizobium sp.]
MVCSLILPRLLAILAIVALVVAPLPATARGGMPVDVAGVMEPMDCCPPGDPAMPDCQKSCPYLALCMAKCFPAANAAFTRLALLDAVKNSHRVSPDESATRRAIRPPAPPPRMQDMAGA